MRRARRSGWWALLLLGLASCAGGAGEAGDAARRQQNLGWVGEGDERNAARSGPAPPPAAAPVPLEACGKTQEGFEGWLESFRRHALAERISQRTVTAALAGLAYDAEVVGLDRSQEAFKLTFAEFSARHLTRGRLTRGKALLASQAPLLAKIEARFGVPPAVLVAIWGLETDFGDNIGSHPCLRALATLAYDCRRPERFRGELMSALRIVERGDLAPEAMVGAWAGELGQTQFLPSSYERFAVDFDGDGRADVVASGPDALASTANYLAEHGWRAREGFAEGTPNFAALKTWNGSEVYVKTVAAFAARLARR